MNRTNLKEKQTFLLNIYVHVLYNSNSSLSVLEDSLLTLSFCVVTMVFTLCWSSSNVVGP